MGEILAGKPVSQMVRAEVQAEAAVFRQRYMLPPGLATVLVGNDPASATYVRNKRKACDACGVASFAHELSADTTQDELIALVWELNQRREVHGILVQLPLPPGIDAAAVLETIDPRKDVDGLHPQSQANLVMGREGLRPCTPLGVMRLLDHTGFELKGARAVIVGRSSLVGKPVAFLLLERHATVTICHSRTRRLDEEVARADVLIAAIGRAEHIRGEWVKPGSVVIDVGINRTPEGKLIGDVEFEAARSRAAWITPVPGGVGLMTVSMLLKNTVQAGLAQEEARANG
jgi:methylenetetrahydrofolate dehydrogenase (NADP+)/methenyltetrahydrofolate cyclohydrolase